MAFVSGPADCCNLGSQCKLGITLWDFSRNKQRRHGFFPWGLGSKGTPSFRGPQFCRSLRGFLYVIFCLWAVHIRLSRLASRGAPVWEPQLCHWSRWACVRPGARDGELSQAGLEHREEKTDNLYSGVQDEIKGAS